LTRDKRDRRRGRKEEWGDNVTGDIKSEEKEGEEG